MYLFPCPAHQEGEMDVELQMSSFKIFLPINDSLLTVKHWGEKLQTNIDILVIRLLKH